MNVKQRNTLFYQGDIDRDDLWPKLSEWKSVRYAFAFEFGLDQLPQEPGLIIVRGPRQFGKSTWLEFVLQSTLKTFGKASAFFLNGDELSSQEELLQALLDLEALFPKTRSIKRIFIDEITAVPQWEKAFKRAYDSGHLRDVLVITTGSNARDLRRGNEKLPGRKGKLFLHDYLFLPISYHQFYKTCINELEQFNAPAWVVYLLSGGSPLAINEILAHQKIPEFLFSLTKDWIQGDVVSSGRDRLFLKHILRCLYRFAPQPVGYAKLARESGMANNTVAAGYIEQLSDLLVVIPSYQFDLEKNVPLLRKPAKFHFINTLAATIYHPEELRCVDDFQKLDPSQKAVLLEWLVAQELYRSAALKKQQAFQGNLEPEELYFWKSQHHEIDFVDPEGNCLEVKLGPTNPMDFLWFKKSFPQKVLTVISASSYKLDWITGTTIHDFLIKNRINIKNDK